MKIIRSKNNEIIILLMIILTVTLPLQNILSKSKQLIIHIYFIFTEVKASNKNKKEVKIKSIKNLKNSKTLNKKHKTKDDKDDDKTNKSPGAYDASEWNFSAYSGGDRASTKSANDENSMIKRIADGAKKWSYSYSSSSSGGAGAAGGSAGAGAGGGCAGGK